MKRLNSRGMSSANKNVLLSALSYNLKKLMKFSRPKVKAISNALHKVSLSGGKFLSFLNNLTKVHTFGLSTLKSGLLK